MSGFSNQTPRGQHKLASEVGEESVEGEYDNPCLVLPPGRQKDWWKQLGLRSRQEDPKVPGYDMNMENTLTSQGLPSTWLRVWQAVSTWEVGTGVAFI